MVKFRYSEKAPQICPSSTFYLTLSSSLNFKWKTGQIFVTFYEYLNFIVKCQKFDFRKIMTPLWGSS